MTAMSLLRHMQLVLAMFMLVPLCSAYKYELTRMGLSLNHTSLILSEGPMYAHRKSPFAKQDSYISIEITSSFDTVDGLPRSPVDSWPGVYVLFMDEQTIEYVGKPAGALQDALYYPATTEVEVCCTQSLFMAG